MEKKSKEKVQQKKETNSKNKLFIILGAVVVLLIIIILAVYFINNSQDNTNKTNNGDGTVNNTNEGVIKEQEIDGLKLTKTSLVYKDGISTLETTVTNNNDEAYYLEEFHIIVKDENGNDIINYKDADGKTINYLVGYAGVEIPSKGSTTIATSIDFDISSAAYTISYELAE